MSWRRSAATTSPSSATSGRSDLPAATGPADDRIPDRAFALVHVDRRVSGRANRPAARVRRPLSLAPVPLERRGVPDPSAPVCRDRDEVPGRTGIRPSGGGDVGGWCRRRSEQKTPQFLQSRPGMGERAGSAGLPATMPLAGLARLSASAHVVAAGSPPGPNVCAVPCEQFSTAASAALRSGSSSVT